MKNKKDWFVKNSKWIIALVMLIIFIQIIIAISKETILVFDTFCYDKVIK